MPSMPIMPMMGNSDPLQRSADFDSLRRKAEHMRQLAIDHNLMIMVNNQPLGRVESFSLSPPNPRSLVYPLTSGIGRSSGKSRYDIAREV